MGPWRYYTDFVLLPAVTALLVWLDLDHVMMASWWTAALAGLILFTFIEYWTHRTILHRMMWHSTHERHHTHPAEYVVFPFWYTPGIYAMAYLVSLCAGAYSTPLFLGFLCGGLWFVGWHHAIHHWQYKPQWIMTYERWHDLHHSGLPVNYGITHPLWDVVFGTYMSYSEGRQLLRERRQ